jgi:hypothetical protein
MVSFLSVWEAESLLSSGVQACPPLRPPAAQPSVRSMRPPAAASAAACQSRAIGSDHASGHNASGHNASGHIAGAESASLCYSLPASLPASLSDNRSDRSDLRQPLKYSRLACPCSRTSTAFYRWGRGAVPSAAHDEQCGAGPARAVFAAAATFETPFGGVHN